MDAEATARTERMKAKRAKWKISAPAAVDLEASATSATKQTNGKKKKKKKKSKKKRKAASLLSFGGDDEG